jgi:VIT1/CCC1 family predicted Fe2+/Mn2+ transporter
MKNANKIIQEYIMQNTPQQSEDVTIVEIIADEVNEALNNLPEIQLASEVLSEDELKELFAPLAKQVVMNVRGRISEKIKTMVAEEITPEQYAALVAGDLGELSSEEKIAALTKLLNTDPDLVDIELSDEAPTDILDTMEDPED